MGSPSRSPAFTRTTGTTARHPAQVNQIATRISRLDDQDLVIAAAYAGMRWGELTGLARTNTHLGDGLIRVDPQVGALHEISRPAVRRTT